MTHSFDPTILREYDIRGIVGRTLHEEDAYALGRTFAAQGQEMGARKLAVGRDGREHSPRLEEALVRGLTEGGMDVVRVGEGPSPMLYWAVSELDVDGGIQITGSHNPADYNGFKMLLPGGSVFGSAIKALGARAAEGRWTEGEGKITDEDVMDRYVQRLVEDFKGGAYRIGWDAGNGAAGPALEKLIKLLPGEHHTLFTDVDGRFPNHHPDPTVEKNLEHLKALVRDKGLDFGIAFDGDGDRIGAVDGQGRVIWGDQLLMILAGPVLEEQPGATIIADVKASQTLFDRIGEMGGHPLMWKTGHSLIKSKMKETGAPLAGEMSGHIFFKHRWYGFDDALYASVRLIEAVAASGKSLTQLRTEMPVSVSTPELRFPVDESRKFAVIEEVRDRLSADGATVDATDGVRVNTPEGWWLLRASNTQDVLVARAEATDQRGLDLLVTEIDQQLALSEIERTEGDH
ncbi:phosphomannomutase [Sphingomonas kaistensis]|uniref:Phosphomannomutase n=1 Tax=Sphingomonas kaistensis TaxID=298708 RepID=A0A7X6BG20_9SPHN|nr:phosphomannomutase/phosphoglucomutase [Sphingomonas kaistensis]NJC04552.1 phosphomannomutase [Sphingomonas kaistensis]